MCPGRVVFDVEEAICWFEMSAGPGGGHGDVWSGVRLVALTLDVDSAGMVWKVVSRSIVSTNPTRIVLPRPAGA
jgi:hypothetical protein